MATSRDEGATFGAPVQVNRVAGDGRVGGEIPPRVALHARAGRQPSPTWSSPGTPRNRAPRSSWRDPPTAAAASARRCRCSRPARPAIAAGTRWPSTTQGTAHVLWLDHRGLAEPGRERGEGGRAPAQGRARRRRDGADVELALRHVRGARLGRSRDHPGRLLLLQVGRRRAARRPAWCRRGVTSTPATCATSRSPCRATAAPRSRHRPGSARTAGRSTAAPTTGRRWPPTRRAASTSCGRR